MSSVLSVRKLHKSFGEKKILSDLSFTLEEGSVTAIMAASGSGKTTLLRILLGLETADSGSVTIDSNTPIQLSAVFQEDRLCENLSPLSNIRLAVGNTVSTAKIKEAFEYLDLSASIHQPVRELSGGMKRRVALIRALLAPWNLLLLDEPFRGLDEDSKIRAMDYVLSFVRTNAHESIPASHSVMKRSILLVTHDVSEAEYMADKIIHL